MIVDLHTHIWESPEQLGRGAAARLLRSSGQPWDRPDASTSAHDTAMEPVQHAVILGFESRYLGASITAEQVARYVARKPEKYLGFAGIDPLSDGSLGKVARVREMGLVGVTINPAGQAMHPAHTQAMKLYEQCVRHDLPVLVQSVAHLSSEAKLEFAQPYLFDEVAREFPDLRLIISQVGYPWVDQAMVLLSKHRNVYADIANVVARPWPLYNVLLGAYQQGVLDRLLFGSDFPFCTPQRAITTIYSVNGLTQGTNLPSVPREQLRSMVERDVLSILGFKTAGHTKSVAKAPPKPAPAPPVAPSPAPVSAAASVAPAATSASTGSNGSDPEKAITAADAAPPTDEAPDDDAHRSTSASTTDLPPDSAPAQDAADADDSTSQKRMDP